VFSAATFKSNGSLLLLAVLSLRRVTITGICSLALGGNLWLIFLQSCLSSGRWHFPFHSVTQSNIDLFLSLIFGIQLSTIFLLGCSLSILLHRSYSCRAAFSRSSSGGLIVTWISHAAVGVDLIAPHMNRRGIDEVKEAVETHLYSKRLVQKFALQLNAFTVSW
jgi:hypothetical protein